MLEELDEEFEGLSGHVFRVKRRGSGLATTYSVIAMGRKKKIDKHELPDVEEKLGPITAKGITKLLKETGAIDDEDDDEEEEEPKKKKRKKKPKPEPEEEEDEDEDWDEV